ncbi:hypothetical protein trd_A0178 (plasmid) [Thermomicrobium roseum DSM 5159]|uniref:Uncharacterized protein n=1 Tax=Thermomicrobium roseum (strain ATCC 27502 / DSM 5159 / P-2) TaxID=309801 RepID=B9L314_THERP|nr:hypothetical protein trd_A0178 [Thermomicrobium roseum DSM 5159]
MRSLAALGRRSVSGLLAERGDVPIVVGWIPQRRPRRAVAASTVRWTASSVTESIHSAGMWSSSPPKRPGSTARLTISPTWWRRIPVAAGGPAWILATDSE